MSKTIESTKKELLEIKHKGKTFRYEFHSLNSLQAETANEIMQWYNDAKSRQKDVNLKEVQRSDLGEVKDTVVAHLVREVTDKKVLLPYSSDEARTTIKEFMFETPSAEFAQIKDKIIKDFFFSQGKLHLATLILREKPKESLTPEKLQVLIHMMNSLNSTNSQVEKNEESAPSKVEN